MGGVSRFAVDPIVTRNIYAAVDDRVKASTDGGITWNDMSAGLTPGDFIFSLAINPRNPQLLYAATVSGIYSYSFGSHVSTLHFPRLVTRGVADIDPELSEYTGVGIVNVDNTNAGLTITAYGLDGTLISGDRITNPAIRFLRAGEQMAVMDSELWGEGWDAVERVGWFTVDSSARIVGFFSTFNQSLSTINGTDVGDESFVSSLFTEVSAAGFTWIHLANPNAVPSKATFEFVDQSGLVKGTALREIEPNGALMEPLSSLFPAAEYTPSDYLRVKSEQTVIPFEATDKPGQVFHVLNGQNSSAGATTLYCPQYVAGGQEWSTTISIVNPSDAEATAVLRLIGDDGTQIGSERAVAIPRGGKAYVADQALFRNDAAAQIQGYLLIESVGTTPAPLIGSASFGDPGAIKMGASLPLVQNLATEFVFSQVASNAIWWSGITIVNPNDGAATVTLKLLDASGSPLGTAIVVIPAGQRISKLLTEPEYFGQLAGKDIGSGYIHVVSDKGVAAFAAYGTHSLSVLATVPAQSVR